MKQNRRPIISVLLTTIKQATTNLILTVKNKQGRKKKKKRRLTAEDNLLHFRVQQIQPLRYPYHFVNNLTFSLLRRNEATQRWGHAEKKPYVSNNNIKKKKGEGKGRGKKSDAIPQAFLEVTHISVERYMHRFC